MPRNSSTKLLASQLYRIPLNTSHKLLTALNSIRYLTFLLTFSLQLPTLSNTSHFSKQTPYSSQLNHIPYISPYILLTTPNSIRYLRILSLQLPTLSVTSHSPYKILTTPNSIRYLTFLLTFSLQLPTLSEYLTFPNILLTTNSIEYL